jgi:hypothetical protein
MEKEIMSKTNDTSDFGHATLEDHRALADSELDAVSGGWSFVVAAPAPGHRALTHATEAGITRAYPTKFLKMTPSFSCPPPFASVFGRSYLRRSFSSRDFSFDERQWMSTHDALLFSFLPSSVPRFIGTALCNSPIRKRAGT